MRNFLLFFIGGFCFFVLSSSNVNAQDWKKQNPEMNKILVDTTLVRAAEVSIEPGKKSDVHTHPAHFFYALTDCKLVIHYSDGKKENYDLKAGQYGYSDPERPHATENAGDKTAKFLIVELKEHPYKATKMKK